MQNPLPPTAPPRQPDGLAFHDVRRRFGRLRVLSGVSGAVETGGVLVVTGYNGSGKSTLVRILAGLLAPEKGAVDLRLDGNTLSTPERRRAVGYVAPDLAFYEELTTLENLELFARLRGVAPERGRELLERVGLPLDRPSGALSSGMRQRLRWTFALLARPRLLLLDEPFQNLDAPGVAQGTELLDEHLDAGGFAVVATPSTLEVPRATGHVHLGG